MESNAMVCTACSLTRFTKRLKKVSSMSTKEINANAILEDYARACGFLKISAPPKLFFKRGVAISYFEETYCRKCSKREERIVIGFCFNPQCLCKSKESVRQRMIHELLHKKGLSHDWKSRKYGFYGDTDRDVLSPRVSDWIFNGGTLPSELEKLQLM